MPPPDGGGRGAGVVPLRLALLEAGCWSLADAEPTLRWIAARQNDDGGFGESDLSFTAKDFVPGPSTAFQTAFVAEALIAHERLSGVPTELRPTLGRAVVWLKARADATDGWMTEESHAGVALQETWYIDYELLPLYVTLIVLNDYAALA